MIHIFNDADSKFCWRVWTDCDEDPETGRCIGVGKTKAEAIADAKQELLEDIAMLRRLSSEEFGNPTNQCESKPPKKLSAAK